ncbi:hypothetical protein ROTAS13_04390 [Roseomonas sp. TAS13]|nr:hypothetical protein ROTAS13_04390 [Roseomonas sp. TAS13]
MAVVVVDGLEVIRVDHEDRQRPAMVPRTREFMGIGLVEATAVRQAGQRVAAGLPAVMGLRTLSDHGHRPEAVQDEEDERADQDQPEREIRQEVEPHRIGGHQHRHTPEGHDRDAADHRREHPPARRDPFGPATPQLPGRDGEQAAVQERGQQHASVVAAVEFRDPAGQEPDQRRQQDQQDGGRAPVGPAVPGPDQRGAEDGQRVRQVHRHQQRQGGAVELKGHGQGFAEEGPSEDQRQVVSRAGPPGHEAGQGAGAGHQGDGQDQGRSVQEHVAAGDPLRRHRRGRRSQASMNPTSLHPHDVIPMDHSHAKVIIPRWI